MAVLCTTCDDVDYITFKSIRAQDYPSVETFVLDDSVDADAQAAVDAAGLTVVRRRTHRGYKAGNLNDWFRRYGDRFKYLVLADADTRLPPNFIAEMVLFGIFNTILALSSSFVIAVAALVGIGVALGCDYPTAHLMISESIPSPIRGRMVLAASGFRRSGAWLARPSGS